MITADFRCWRCDDDKGLEPLGLCERCEAELHEEKPQPPKPNATVLAPGHLPEEIPEQYVPAEKDWWTSTIADPAPLPRPPGLGPGEWSTIHQAAYDWGIQFVGRRSTATPADG